MNRGTWWATVHGVEKSWTWLSNWAHTFISYILPYMYIPHITLYMLYICVLSCFSNVWLLAILGTAAHKNTLPMGFSKQEYWNRMLCPSPGDLLGPEIEFASLTSPAFADGFFTTNSTCESHTLYIHRLLCTYKQMKPNIYICINTYTYIYCQPVYCHPAYLTYM